MKTIDAIIIRDNLTPSINKPFLNPFNEIVYLKPLYRNNKRIGLTECCEYSDPCNYHLIFKKTDKTSNN